MVIDLFLFLRENKQFSTVDVLRKVHDLPIAWIIELWIHGWMSPGALVIIIVILWSLEIRRIERKNR